MANDTKRILSVLQRLSVFGLIVIIQEFKAFVFAKIIESNLRCETKLSRKHINAEIYVLYFPKSLLRHLYHC